MKLVKCDQPLRILEVDQSGKIYLVYHHSGKSQMEVVHPDFHGPLL